MRHCVRESLWYMLYHLQTNSQTSFKCRMVQSHINCRLRHHLSGINQENCKHINRRIAL